MENRDRWESPDETTPQLVVTENMRSYFYDITKWANFLAIVGFVITAIILLTVFTLGSALQATPELGEKLRILGLSAGGFSMFLLLFALAVFYPSLLLIQYSVKARIGVLFADQTRLEDALSKLKALFKYWGLVVILFIGMYIMAFIMTLAAFA